MIWAALYAQCVLTGYLVGIVLLGLHEVILPCGSSTSIHRFLVHRHSRRREAAAACALGAQRGGGGAARQEAAARGAGAGRRRGRNIRALAVRHCNTGKRCERLLWYGIFHVSSCLPLCLARSMSAEISPRAGTYTRLCREAQLLHAPAGARGRLHVSEVDDGEPGEGAQNPLERYPMGAALRAVVLEQPSSRAVRSAVQLMIFRV